jgi:hypothetical protein
MGSSSELESMAIHNCNFKEISILNKRKSERLMDLIFFKYANTDINKKHFAQIKYVE